MPKYNIEDLIKKIGKGTLLPEEQDFLERWYLVWRPEDVDISDKDIELAKARVWSSLQTTPKVLKPWYWLSAVGAIVLVVLMFMFLEGGPSDVKNEQFHAQRILNDFKPGGTKAVLTLANGEQVILDEKASGPIAKQGNTAIRRAKLGKLVYENARTESKISTMINKVATPRGGEFQLMLSDGTKVWLNAASSITFPVTFANGHRRVTVTGEAYFEVAHDKNRPFIVTTAEQEIAVLGTHFNISAYVEDGFTSTSLISGLVNIKNIESGSQCLLRPGQGGTTTLNSLNIKLHTINTDEVLSWKNGYFQFDNQSIYTILKVMGRWYDVDVEYSNLQNSERFGGTFSRGRNLSESLANLEKLGKVHFKLTSKKLIVSD